MIENPNNLINDITKPEGSTKAPTAGELAPQGSIEKSLDDKIIELLSTGKFNDSKTKILLEEWANNNGWQEINQEEIININLYVEYALKKINLFEKAFEKIENPDEKEKIKNMIKERLDELLSTATSLYYENLDLIKNKIIEIMSLKI